MTDLRGVPFRVEEDVNLGKIELYAWQDAAGFWWAQVWKAEWHIDYGDIGVSLFQGRFATRGRAESGVREAVQSQIRNAARWHAEYHARRLAEGHAG